MVYCVVLVVIVLTTTTTTITTIATFLILSFSLSHSEKIVNLQRACARGL